MDMLKALLIVILLLSIFFVGKIFRLWWRLNTKKKQMQIIVPREKKDFRRILTMGIVFAVWLFIIAVTVLVGHI
jgi:Na+-transporting methylmalonyl-CoA/oxaloacetate decarboxylase gamma subunit